MVAVRHRSSGGELVVVAAEDPREDLVAIFTGSANVVRDNPQNWLQREGRPTDLVVLPGGRNGALSTARLTRQAVLTGATVAVADRRPLRRSAPRRLIRMRPIDVIDDIEIGNRRTNNRENGHA
jgi:hypothetical protein